MRTERGFTLIELMIVIAIIAIIAAIAIPDLLAARKSANESSATGSCRTCFNAEQVYKDTGKSRRFDATATNEYAPNLVNLYTPTGGTPADGTLSDNVLATTGDKAGYAFGLDTVAIVAAGSIADGDGDCTMGGTIASGALLRYQWEMYAGPTDPGNTGDRCFWTSEAGVILAASDTGAASGVPARNDTTGVWSTID